MTLILIDADGLAFHSLRETLLESLEVLDVRVKNILTKTGATHYTMFLSGGKYFRHDLFDGYKKIREKQKPKVSWKNTLKAVLAEKYGAVKMYNVEADDLVCYLYYNMSPMDKVILSSPDKDLLFNVPGMHFNYSYKLKNKEDPSSIIEGWWVKTTEEEARRNFWASMIVGDSSDSIIGLHGKGEKYTNKVFEKHLHELTYRDIVFNEYIDYHGESKGIYEFQKTYRALSLLSSAEEFEREVGVDEQTLNEFCSAAIIPVPSEKESEVDININSI